MAEILPKQHKILYTQSIENLTELLISVSQTCLAKSIKFIESNKQFNKNALKTPIFILSNKKLLYERMLNQMADTKYLNSKIV